jgi:hypothetical protein
VESLHENSLIKKLGDTVTVLQKVTVLTVTFANLWPFFWKSIVKDKKYRREIVIFFQIENKNSIFATV